MIKNDNSNENSIVKDNIDFENTEIGQAYIIQLKTGSIISGALISKNEFLKGNKTVRAYTIAFNNSKVIDLEESEIDRMDLVEHYNENHKSVLEYLKEFQKRHNVKCFNDKGEVLSSSTILGEVVVGKKLWDDLLEEEKREFIGNLRLSAEDIVEVINATVDYMRENAKLHENKMRVLDASVDFFERYNAGKKAYPHLEKVYEFLYKESGIEDLIKAI